MGVFVTCDWWSMSPSPHQLRSYFHFAIWGVDAISRTSILEVRVAAFGSTLSSNNKQLRHFLFQLAGRIRKPTQVQRSHSQLRAFLDCIGGSCPKARGSSKAWVPASRRWKSQCLLRGHEWVQNLMFSRFLNQSRLYGLKPGHYSIK